MKATKIQVKNYRLLKDFELNLESKLSLIVGKNNTGKTSLLYLFEKFLISGGKDFEFEEINVAVQKQIISDLKTKNISTDYDKGLGIELKVHIEYDEADNLEKISAFMLDLNPKKILLYCSLITK